MKPQTQNTLILLTAIAMLFFILGYSISHLTDDAKQERERRSKMYKIIGDENGN